MSKLISIIIILLSCIVYQGYEQRVLSKVLIDNSERIDATTGRIDVLEGYIQELMKFKALSEINKRINKNKIINDIIAETMK